MSKKSLSPEQKAHVVVHDMLGDPSMMQSKAPPAPQLTASSIQRAEPEFPDTMINPPFDRETHTGDPLHAKGDGDLYNFWYNDVQQGTLLDCYLLSVLSAIARTQPHLLYERIQPLSNGNYRVTLYRRSRGSYSPVTYEVTPTFPTAGAASGDNGEIWVQVMEKAFAMHNGNSYENLDGAANPATPMGQFFGRDAEEKDIRWQMNKEQIRSNIQHALDNNIPCVLGTPGFYTNPLLNSEADNLGIVRGHAYTAVHIEGHNVTLYNPQGSAADIGQPLMTFTTAEIKKFFTRMILRA